MISVSLTADEALSKILPHFSKKPVKALSLVSKLILSEGSLSLSEPCIESLFKTLLSSMPLLLPQPSNLETIQSICSKLSPEEEPLLSLHQTLHGLASMILADDSFEFNALVSKQKELFDETKEKAIKEGLLKPEDVYLGGLTLEKQQSQEKIKPETQDAPSDFSTPYSRLLFYRSSLLDTFFSLAKSIPSKPWKKAPICSLVNHVFNEKDGFLSPSQVTRLENIKEEVDGDCRLSSKIL